MVIERAFKLVVVVGAVALLAAHLAIGRAWPRMAETAAATFLLFALLARIDRRAIAIIFASSCLLPPLIWFTLGTFGVQFWILWIAASLGAMLPDLVTTGWHIPPRLRAPLLLVSLAVIVATPIVAAREIDFNPALIGDVPNAVLSGLPWHAAEWVVQVGVTTLVGILWFEWLLGAPALDLDAVCLRPLVLSVSASAVIATYQMLSDISFLNETAYGAIGRASGTLFDANVAGMLAAVGIGLACVLTERAPRRPGWLVLVPLLGMAVWASGSRTATGAALIVLFVSGFTLWRSHSTDNVHDVATLPHAPSTSAGARARSTRRWMVGAMLAGAAVVTVMLLSGVDATTVGPLRRFGRMLPSASSGRSLMDVAAELWRRNGYGTASTYLIARFPWAGIGVGSFHLFGPALSPVGPRPPDNAQNWLRHHLVEMGLLGGIGWILFAGAFGWFAVTAWRSRDPRSRHLCGVLAAFAVVSLFGLPTQEVVAAVTFWVVAASLVRGRARHEDLAALSPRTLATIVLVTVAFGAVTWHLARTQLRVPVRAQQLGWPYSYGFYDAEPDGAGGLVRWMGKRAAALIEVHGPLLRVSVRSPLPNIERDPVALSIWADNRLVLRTRVSSGHPVVATVPVRPGATHILLDIRVNRTVRPREVGGVADDRDLGALVAWAFTTEP